jgi:hypothetical protein
VVKFGLATSLTKPLVTCQGIDTITWHVLDEALLIALMDALSSWIVFSHTEWRLGLGRGLQVRLIIGALCLSNGLGLDACAS